jgi:hypothetical protein
LAIEGSSAPHQPLHLLAVLAEQLLGGLKRFRFSVKVKRGRHPVRAQQDPATVEDDLDPLEVGDLLALDPLAKAPHHLAFALQGAGHGHARHRHRRRELRHLGQRLLRPRKQLQQLAQGEKGVGGVVEAGEDEVALACGGEKHVALPRGLGEGPRRRERLSQAVAGFGEHSEEGGGREHG